MNALLTYEANSCSLLTISALLVSNGGGKNVLTSAFFR